MYTAETKQHTEGSYSISMYLPHPRCHLAFAERGRESDEHLSELDALLQSADTAVGENMHGGRLCVCVQKIGD